MKTKKTYRSNLNCQYCEAKNSPDYKDYKAISAFITDRAKILHKDRSGLCSKHQRQLATAIKRARFLGLIPYVVTA